MAHAPDSLRPLRRVAVLHHPKITASQGIAAEVGDWLKAQGVDAWPAFTWDEGQIRPRIPEIDMIIVLGGDGSLLRAGRMAAGHNVPILGINMGRVGFLSEMSLANWRDRLPRVLAGEYWVEERMMLRAQTWHREEPIGEHVALNDVVISRGSLARVVRLHTEVDGDRLTTYVADGLIVSTPTGSTAYALAAGGPILPPELRSMLLVPIAPHLTFDRPIILPEGSRVRIQVATDHQSIVTVDGQFEVELEDEDFIEVCASEAVSWFVRLGKRTYFYQSLIARMEPRYTHVQEREWDGRDPDSRG